MRTLAAALTIALGLAGQGQASASARSADTAVSSLVTYAGQHALTKNASMSLTQKEGSWWLSIGAGKPVLIEPESAGGWRVPSLGIHLSPDEGGTLWLSRYGERIAVAGAGAVLPAGRSTEQSIADLTPRAMVAFNVPGVSIALVRDRKLAWLAHYGVAAAGRPEKVDADTIFEAA